MTSTFLRWLAFFWVVQTLLRGGFLITLLDEPTAAAGDLFGAMLAGLLHDALGFGVLVLPVLIVMVAFDISKARQRVMLDLVSFVVLVVWVIAEVGEVFFWNEFDGRLNRLVFHYLAYPLEVLSFLDDQFFFSLVIVPILGGCYVLQRLLRRRLKQVTQRWQKPYSRLRVGLVASVIVGALIFVQPLRPSDSRQVNELANNGLFGVIHAASLNVEDWNAMYPSIAARSTGHKIDSGNQGQASVSQAPVVTKTRPAVLDGVKHVVLIIEESFSGATWFDPELRETYLPELNRWRQKGLYFDNIYATGSRTTRGMEALLHGYPPLPGIALTQRRGFERLPSLPRRLAENGFATHFVYGGWPSFSNFADYWQGIGFETVLSKYDFADRWFETSWGVADEILFERVLAEMDLQTQRSERVFLSTLTVTHHRPYDFPAGRVDFSAQVRKREHAMAYADWSVGRFLDAAATKPWFDDTLFIVVADHGPQPEGNAFVPAASFRVPLIFIAPQHLRPAVVSHLGSTMSVPKTLLGMLNIQDDAFYGADLRGGPTLVPLEHDYHVGLLDDDVLTVLPHKGQPRAWRYSADRTLWPIKAENDQVADVIELFEGAHRSFYE